MESISSNGVVVEDPALRLATAHRDAMSRSVNTIMSNLTEVAAMAYGSGITEGAKGGAGNIGVLNGKVVKFNTHRSERNNIDTSSDKYSEMLKASDELRDRLATMTARAISNASPADKYKTPTQKEISALNREIAQLLSLSSVESVEGQNRTVDLLHDQNDAIPDLKEGMGHFIKEAGRGLLTRSAAAKAVTLIRDFIKSHVCDKKTQSQNREMVDTADLDLHIWSKVRNMKGLSSSSSSGDFDYVNQLKSVLNTVQGEKAAIRRDLQAAGNNVMEKRFQETSIRLNLGHVTLNLSQNVSFENLESTQANGMLRYYRAESLAKAMDAVFETLKTRKSSLANQPSIAKLGNNPFTASLNRALASVLGKKEQWILDQTVPRQSRQLSRNEYRNVLAMMRNDILAFVSSRSNEIIKIGQTKRIDEGVMLAKDIMRSCAKILSMDEHFDEDVNYSFMVESDDTLTRAHTTLAKRVFEKKEIGTRFFALPSAELFTDYTL